MYKKLLLFSLVMLWVSPSYAQNWSGILDPSRAIDWANVGIPEGITDRTTICDTISPYTGTAATINTAIQNCSAGEVVFLSAGTFNLSTGVTFNDKSNVTLRGAGPDATFLIFTGKDVCGGAQANICVPNGHLNHGQAPGNEANWTAGYAKGTTVVTLDDTTNLQVGTLLILDQQNDTDTDTGDIWICSTGGTCAYEGPGGAGRIEDPRRELIQQVRVTAIDGSNITISPGLYMPNWRSGRNPGAWWSNDTPITGVGIEDLSADHTGSNHLYSIAFFNAYKCWIKNIRSIKSQRAHVQFGQSARIIVRDSYFYDTKAGASQSYGMEFFATTDCLVENNIFESIATPLSNNGSAQGNVFSYNYTIEVTFDADPTQNGLAPLDHANGVSMNLYEGNASTGLEGDLFHGTHQMQTMFRNRWVGWQTGTTANTFAVHLHALCRYYNLIGGILGTSTHHTIYQNGFTGGFQEAAIYFLGWSNTNPNPPHDESVQLTMMRWGNCDTVTDTCRFESSEVPSGLSVYANPVPGDEDLPDSFYLSARPAWFDTAFGSVPWPPIGPDVTDGDDGDADVGGFAYKIPALLCYENTPATGDILDFNADDCYEGAGSSGAAISGSVKFGGTVTVQ